jgi:DNA polymerase-3 subunit gamma/tau
MERPATAAAITPSPAPNPFQGSTPFAASATPATGYGSAETLTEGALARAPQAVESVAASPSIESIRQAVVTALTEAGHESAALMLGAGAWTLNGSSVRVEVAGMGKKMLALTVNAAAEKIIRQELQRLGAPARFMAVPGEGTAHSAAPMATPLVGSIQEAALANPLVQRAKELFKAEVRSVVDLRQK